MIKSSDLKNEYDEVEDNIFVSFKKYIESVKSKFQDSNSTKVIKHLTLYNFNNKIKIEELESEQEFYQLLDDTMKIKSPFVNSTIIFKNHERFFWESPIKNFFRRSSCYLDIINKRDIDCDLLFNDYLKSFRKEKTQTTYFALVESVSFSKESMDFGSFKICRFKTLELDTIFNKAINEIFYPFAVMDSKCLQNYWFICVGDDEIFKEFSFDYDGKVKLDHSKFAKPIELALKKFSLFDWQLNFARDSDEKNKLWIAPELPYIFKINDNLLDSPSQIYFDYRKLLFESHTNEEIGEQPQFFIHFDNKETVGFEKFIFKIERIFNVIFLKNTKLKFIDNALGYFIKAFFAQDMEQLLWHLSTIEALLGDKTDGITSNLARRSALVIALKREDRKEIRKKFKDLYGFRSKLVHGSIFTEKSEKVYVGHLFNARDISRRIILWFLYFIYDNIQNTDKQKSFPTREDILDLIDLEPEKICNFIAT
ncbi:Uncharacterized protein dnl_42180 [Desulfonema limicola]|uniref:Apea-like HEPN domain-containing protein n=1 Tax=Desulfonema limicola TaxID=45656 RepID=A0A975BAV9_9BACT|nr:HEPN domain-containing protein [Desulfonema limicola]QTA81864.1 Uncharacterized protein dnl_42180 [Desulfonema limicola]